MALTPKRQRFVHEYLIDMNATQAAIRAGYSQKAAQKIAWELLQFPEVKAAIKDAQADLAEAAQLNAVMILLELKRVAFSDLSDFVEWGPKGVQLLPHDQVDSRAVAEVGETVTEAGGSKRIKLHDKLGAIDRINKMLGWNAPDKQEVSGPGGGPVEVEVSDAKQRLAERLARAQRKADPGTPGHPDGSGS